jgi:hypothetical protein
MKEAGATIKPTDLMNQMEVLTYIPPHTLYFILSCVSLETPGFLSRDHETGSMTTEHPVRYDDDTMGDDKLADEDRSESDSQGGEMEDPDHIV